MTLSEALKVARKKRGLSKWQVAKVLGVGWLTVHAWEEGKYLPRADKLLKLARLFPELLELVNGGDEDGEERKER